MDRVFMAASPVSLNITSATIRTLSNASVAYKNFKGSQLRALTGLEFSSSTANEEASTRLGGSLSKLQQLVSTAAAAKPPSESYSTTVAGVSFPSNTTGCSSSNSNNRSSSQYSASMKTSATGVEIRAPTSIAPSPSESEPISPGVATRWRELHGSNYWKGLLDPLDADLRSELIRYGEFSQVTYDSFDHDKHSMFYGSNRYRKDKLFEKVKHLNTGYEVTHYIYATADLSMPKLLSLCKAPDAWSRDSNWMGYVAVCTDEEKIKQLGRRDILIAWRGTLMGTEWAANAQIKMVPFGIDSRHSYNLTTAALRVEMGFLNVYTSKNSETRYNKTSARQQVLTELKRLIEKYKGEELSITVTGHSLGSALATLNAYDIAQSGLNRITDPAAAGDSCPIPENWGDKTADPVRPDKEATIPIAVMSFAGPRVGNNAFCDQLNALGVKVLRVVNVNDFVPRVPGNLFPPQLSFIDKLIDLLPFTYSHAGVQLLVNNFDSPYLDPMRSNIFNNHNLEGYLHVVYGHQGSDGLGKKHNSASFPSPPSRDIALVNKSSDFLKDGHFIPDSWWQVENKGLVYQDSDGKWIQQTRDADDVPVPPVTHKKPT